MAAYLGIGTAQQNLDAVLAYEEFVGYKADWFGCYSEQAGWDNFGTSNANYLFNSSTGRYALLAQLGKRCLFNLALNQPFVASYDDGSTLADVVAGTWTSPASVTYNIDAKYQQTAQVLIDNGLADAFIKLGWEVNTPVYAWGVVISGSHASVTNQAWVNGPTVAGAKANYISAFQHVHDLMMAVPGAKFKFIWSPTRNDNGAGDPLGYYPGDAYVDYIGCHVYDNWYPESGQDPQNDLANRWIRQMYGLDGPGGSGGVGQTYRLKYFRDLARSKGKQMIIGEWGAYYSTATPSPVANTTDSKGGDDYYFVNQMTNFINTQTLLDGVTPLVVGHMYWERTNTASAAAALEFASSYAGVVPAQLDLEKPLASLAFRAGFGR